ncbi:nitroreductase [Candidatus Bathyarchaeota archaeon]|nr:nitroreductase [Candidatus Bathyarchaeota archaeon]
MIIAGGYDKSRKGMIDMEFSTFKKLAFKRRTIRRFTPEPVSTNILKDLVDLGRIAPAGGNSQAVEYIIVNREDMREKLFPLLRWAASLPPDMRTPEEGRRPMAYIIVLLNTEIKKGGDHDVGAAVENILLGATSVGLGACWMGAIDRKKIRTLLNVPKTHDVKHVISIGYPDEESVMEVYDDSFKYWKDDGGRMHVPKRELDGVILKIVD